MRRALRTSSRQRKHAKPAAKVATRPMRRALRMSLPQRKHAKPAAKVATRPMRRALRTSLPQRKHAKLDVRVGNLLTGGMAERAHMPNPPLLAVVADPDSVPKLVAR